MQKGVQLKRCMQMMLAAIKHPTAAAQQSNIFCVFEEAEYVRHLWVQVVAL